jgi:hypothetical protein
MANRGLAYFVDRPVLKEWRTFAKFGEALPLLGLHFSGIFLKAILSGCSAPFE